MLGTQEQILIEQRVANESKSIGAAYLLWFFTGGLGGHRFYLGRTGSGAAILVMTLVGVLTTVIGVGAVVLLAVGIWVLVDAFLIPGMVQQDKTRLREHYSVLYR